jgi:cell division protein FtsL
VAGLLLAGVVAVNVLVLRQNVELDHATSERTRLRAENAGLASQVSAAVSASRIEGLAQRSLGLVPASPEGTTYLDLGRAK